MHWVMGMNRQIALGEKMVARGIKPELECFDLGHVASAAGPVTVYSEV